MNRGTQMISKEQTKMAKEIFKKYNYVMTTCELVNEKLYYADIKRLLNEKKIERIRQGYYFWIESSEIGEIVIINKLFPDAILCMETALFYYGYSDRTPSKWSFTIDRNVSKYRTKIEYPFVKVYLMESDLMQLGESEGKIDYEKVRIYDRDRTICDVLKNMNKMDKEIFNKAIQNYINDSKKNIPSLMYYAKKMHVQKKVKDIIEVWL